MSTTGNAESYVELRGSLSIPDAIHGKSAYELAVMHGYDGTEEEWLLYLERAQSEAVKEAAEQAKTDIAEAKATMLEEIEIAGDIVQTEGQSESAVMSQKAVTDELDKIRNDMLTDDDIPDIIQATTAKVKELLDGTKPIHTTVTLLASAWVGEEDPYSQIVNIEGVTEHSKVDLQPSVEQLAIFHDKDLAFVTENEDGVVTVYAIGDRPTKDYTMQATITEVDV